jgi:hypothetical protein
MKTAKEIVALIASAHPPMLDEQELEALEQVINLPGHPIPFHAMDTPLVARLTRMVKALAAHVEAPTQPEPPKAEPQSHKSTGAALITEDFKGTLTPAYGRKYANRAEALADWRLGRDFMLSSPQGQTYCSIDNFAPGVKVELAYGVRNEKK